MLLALDTSTSYASVALARGDHLLAEQTWEVGQRHSAELFDRIQQVLRAAGVTPAVLEGVAVATGPGSFNGVRVALTAAKSLSFSLGIPLYGHPTLDVIGWGHARAATPIWALIEAGRGQVYAARYLPAASPTGWAPQSPYAVLAPQELAARVEGDTLVAGEMRAETRAALGELLGDRARFTSPLEVRRASWLAELALARTTADDPFALEPLYLRKPNITKSAKVGLAPNAKESGDATSGRQNGEGVAHAIRH